MCRYAGTKYEPFSRLFDTSGTSQVLYLNVKINHSLFTPFESRGIALRGPHTKLNREDGHFPVLSFLGILGFFLSYLNTYE